MPTKTKPAPPAQTTDLARIKEATAKEIAPVLASASQVLTIDPAIALSPDNFRKADEQLSKVLIAREWIEVRFDPILKPLAEAKRNNEIARKATMALVNELDAPLKVIETGIRDWMRKFKLEEMRIEAARQEKADEESASLQQEANAKREKEEAARTAPMRERLRLQREELERKALEVQAPAPEPVKALNSGTRTVTKWHVTDLNLLLLEALEGRVPVEMGVTDRDDVIITLKHSQRAGGACPGVESYLDIQIVRR